jgi:hypothetical protein
MAVEIGGRIILFIETRRTSFVGYADWRSMMAKRFVGGLKLVISGIVKSNVGYSEDRGK